MSLYFYVRQDNFEGVGNTFKYAGDKYSIFSARMRSLKHAKDFLRRNGEFWHKRGHKLILFDRCNMIGHAEVDKLKLIEQ